ncbi:MAG TPA: hypothetical protein VMW47_12995 [Verrucomicrobiae bacterium]|nr:hypothetical protein [Verrucomicrobiae bacterium]
MLVVVVRAVLLVASPTHARLGTGPLVTIRTPAGLTAVLAV